MKIKAAVTHAKGAPFVIEEVELAEPKFDEILVRIAACGICHTDLVCRDQFIPVPLPAVLGHEGAGIVEKVGVGVTEFKPATGWASPLPTAAPAPAAKKGSLMYAKT